MTDGERAKVGCRRFSGYASGQPYTCVWYSSAYRLDLCVGVRLCEEGPLDREVAISDNLQRSLSTNSLATYPEDCYSMYMEYYGNYQYTAYGKCDAWSMCLTIDGVVDVLDEVSTPVGSNYCRKFSSQLYCCRGGYLRQCNLPRCTNVVEMVNVDYINGTYVDNVTYSDLYMTGYEYIQADVMVHGHYLVGSNSILPADTITTVFYEDMMSPGEHFTRVNHDYVYIVANDSRPIEICSVIGKLSLYVNSIDDSSHVINYIDHKTGKYATTQFKVSPRWITVINVTGCIRVHPASFDASAGRHVHYYLQSQDLMVASCIMEEANLYEALMICLPLAEPELQSKVYFVYSFDGKSFVEMDRYTPTPIISNHETLRHYSSHDNETEHCHTKREMAATKDSGNYMHYLTTGNDEVYFSNLTANRTDGYILYGHAVNISLERPVGRAIKTLYDYIEMPYCSTEPPYTVHMDQDMEVLTIKSEGNQLRVRRQTKQNETDKLYREANGVIVLDLKEYCNETDYEEKCHIYFSVGADHYEHLVPVHWSRCPQFPPLNNHRLVRINDVMYKICHNFIYFWLTASGVLLLSIGFIASMMYVCCGGCLRRSAKLCCCCLCGMRCCLRRYRKLKDYDPPNADCAETSEESTPRSTRRGQTTSLVTPMIAMLFLLACSGDCYELQMETVEYAQDKLIYSSTLVEEGPVHVGQEYKYHIAPKTGGHIGQPLRISMKVIDVRCSYDSEYRYWSSHVETKTENTYTCCGEVRCDKNESTVSGYVRDHAFVYVMKFNRVFPSLFGYARILHHVSDPDSSVLARPLYVCVRGTGAGTPDCGS